MTRVTLVESYQDKCTRYNSCLFVSKNMRTLSKGDVWIGKLFGKIPEDPGTVVNNTEQKKIQINALSRQKKENQSEQQFWTDKSPVNNPSNEMPFDWAYPGMTDPGMTSLSAGLCA